MPGTVGGSPAAGVPGTESDEHEVPNLAWPGRDEYPPPANRSPGTVYPSTGAPAQPAPEHQQPPAIPPPDDESELEESAGTAAAAQSYGKWARNERASAGTVYGGPGGTSVSSRPADGGGSPFESSGSLTGHILSQGTEEADDDEAPAKSGNLKVIIIIAIIVVVLIVGGYFAVTLARSFMDSVFSGVPQK
jgi:hypothetical protein